MLMSHNPSEASRKFGDVDVERTKLPRLPKAPALRTLAVWLVLFSLLILQTRTGLWRPSLSRTDVDAFSKFQRCSVERSQSKLRDILRTAKPLPIKEYIERRDRLAKALVADGVDSFIVEPGYTFKYYANISQPEWEVWEPEERPFLMVVQPVTSAQHGSIEARTTFLAPAFEVERVRLLQMPFENDVRVIPWEEHWDPYKTLYEADIWDKARATVMVDEEMRDFIQRGLGNAGFHVIGLGGEVEKVRQTKSDPEIDILRAANTATVEAIRQMRKCLLPGLTESQVSAVLDDTLRAAGMDPFFDIVLFDEDASNPHGGTGGHKSLEDDTFILIDVGAHLYGYSSDVCRTFFPPFLPRTADNEKRLSKKIDIWNIVFEAQTESIKHFKENETAASVDIAARKVITDAGFGKTFTHRVGHGIGIKAHESPYLHKGNNETLLRAGMTFTTEPGIYLVDEFGVRHEDVFLVTNSNEPRCLSCPRARDPWSP